MLLRRLRRHKSASDPVAVVSRFVDAANRHDADAIAKCLHPDFESIQPIYPSRNFRGSTQVRRNWQAIFESEPGFRLSLVRSSSSDNTVWVELHGAGRDVEVAGVFIMGVEDELVRWARVYSAVVEQPAPRMAATEPAAAVDVAPPPTAQEQAEELRRVIDAGRPSGEDGDAEDADAAEEDADAAAFAEIDVLAATTVADEAFAPLADGDTDHEAADAGEGADTDDGDDDEGDDDGDDEDADDEDDEEDEDDAEEDDDDDYDDDEDEDDDDDDVDDDDEEAEDDQAEDGQDSGDEDEGSEDGPAAGVVGAQGAADGGIGWPEPGVGGGTGGEGAPDGGIVWPEAGVVGGQGDEIGGQGAADGGIVWQEAGDPAVGGSDADADVANVDDFWSGGQVHDLVGGDKRRRRGRDQPEAAGGGLGWGDDALVVDINDRGGGVGDDPDPDDAGPGRSGRRRGGRRRR